MTEKTYATDRGVIHYWAGGAVPSELTLVFLPGLTADHRLFDQQLGFFPDESVPVAAKMLSALPQAIPQIRTLEVGADVKHSERSYDMALIVTFDSMDDLAIYDKHPEHEKARAYIKAHRTATATVDFAY